MFHVEQVRPELAKLGSEALASPAPRSVWVAIGSSFERVHRLVAGDVKSFEWDGYQWRASEGRTSESVHFFTMPCHVFTPSAEDSCFECSLHRRVRDGLSDLAGVARSSRPKPVTCVVMEVFSPPRVCTEAKRQGLPVGESLDLQTGWDFRNAADRSRAWDILDRDRPWLLLLEPVCSSFSVMQRSNVSRMPEEKLRRQREEGLAMLAFCIRLACEQHRCGRRFVIEQPASASSWETEGMRLLASLPGVEFVYTDMCAFGMNVDGSGLNKKPTGWLTNDACVAERLRRRVCSGLHRHVPLEGGRPSLAQVYPQELCRTLVAALRESIAQRADASEATKK